MIRFRFKSIQAIVLVLICNPHPWANSWALATQEHPTNKETIPIKADRDLIRKQPGSAFQIDEATLKQFDHSDVERILTRVPGVTLQGEDGYGLRPNIGMRGVNPHRSRKISLMEDGILVAPAPYAAPAAYYFPSMEMISDIDVFKGVTAIPYGPQNLGGALNLWTKSPIAQRAFEARIRAGSYGEKKFATSFEGRSKDLGYMALLDHLESDGFKHFKSKGGDTGFAKTNGMIKGVYEFDARGMEHEFIIKLNRALEKSHETYLGLSKEDFLDDPYQRYDGSKNDLMDWNRNGMLVALNSDNNQNFRSSLKLYQHKFHRSWSKFNGFGEDSVDPRQTVLDNQSHYFKVLRGDENSVSLSGSDLISLGTNDRRYKSRGIQWQGTYSFLEASEHTQRLKLSIRHHYDEVVRHHFEELLTMTDHELLESSPRNFATTTQNKDDVTALTSAIGYEYETNSFGIYPMMRYESLDLCTRDDLLSTKKCFQSGYGSYGLGVNLFPTNHLQILTGVGTSIGAPSPSDESDTKLEEAINYELGVRFTQKTLRTEVIGFYSDYSNINGVCTQSSGCDLESLDQTFSGGRAQVYGIESSLSQIFMASGYRFPITASYTYTFGAFLNSSPSENPDWGLGIIQKGDPLPYIPEHRAFASAGIEDKKWGLHLSSSYTGTQFDQSVVENRKVLEPYNVIDLSTYYIVSEFCTIDVKVDNLADQKYVSSIRPYGYRPGKPQTFSFGVRSRF